MLYAILPDTDQIALICAPYRPFTTAAGKEKAALACGYLLHPEYKEEFGPQRQEAYEVFLKEELAGYMNRLLETELIVDVTEALWRREIVRDPQIIQQYISYARTRITNRNEKKRLDAIESEAGLKEGLTMRDALVDEDRDLLRRLRASADMAAADRFCSESARISAGSSLWQRCESYPDHGSGGGVSSV